MKKRTVTPADLEDLMSSLTDKIIRKFKHRQVVDRDLLDEMTEVGSKFIVKWLRKNAHAVDAPQTRSDVWKIHLELATGDTIILVFKRSGFYVAMTDDGLEMSPIFGSFLTP